MSPELVRGEPYGPPSDAWAVGVLLFEMLSLERPFEGPNAMNTILLISSGKPRPAAVAALESSGHRRGLIALLRQ